MVASGVVPTGAAVPAVAVVIEVVPVTAATGSLARLDPLGRIKVNVPTSGVEIFLTSTTALSFVIVHCSTAPARTTAAGKVKDGNEARFRSESARLGLRTVAVIGLVLPVTALLVSVQMTERSIQLPSLGTTFSDRAVLAAVMLTAGVKAVALPGVTVAPVLTGVLSRLTGVLNDTDPV